MGSESNIPTIVFTQENTTPGTASYASTCSRVTDALERFGFFLATYNPEKLPLRVHDETFSVVKELFDLPTETKVKNRYDKPLNGYVGQIAKLPLHESLGIDDAPSLDATQKFTEVMWPKGNPRFRDVMHAYAKISEDIDKTVTRMIFDGYGVGKYYDSYIDSTTYLLRILKNRAPMQDEQKLAFVRHSDKSFTTIVHQHREVSGLEVETKDGDWILVDLSLSNFAVMAGDALMAWSNDRIKSPFHKVTNHGDEDRYSLAQFSFNGGMLEVPPELVDEDHPLKYKPFDHLGLLRYFRTEEGHKAECLIKAYCGV